MSWARLTSKNFALTSLDFAPSYGHMAQGKMLKKALDTLMRDRGFSLPSTCFNQRKSFCRSEIKRMDGSWQYNDVKQNNIFY